MNGILRPADLLLSLSLGTALMFLVRYDYIPEPDKVHVITAPRSACDSFRDDVLFSPYLDDARQWPPVQIMMLLKHRYRGELETAARRQWFQPSSMIDPTGHDQPSRVTAVHTLELAHARNYSTHGGDYETFDMLSPKRISAAVGG